MIISSNFTLREYKFKNICSIFLGYYNEKPKVDLEEKDYLLVPNINNYLFSKNGDLVSFYKFFKNANDLESLKIEINQLSKENLLKIIEILISNNLIKVFVGNSEIPMFVKSNNLYYLNYEFIIYFFITIVNEQNKLVKALKGTNSTLVLDYPVSFVLDYLNAFKTTYNLSLVEDDRWKPRSVILDGIAYKINLIQISADFISYLHIACKDSLLLNAKEIDFLTKDEEKEFKLEKKVCNVNLESFRGESKSG